MFYNNIIIMVFPDFFLTVNKNFFFTFLFYTQVGDFLDFQHLLSGNVLKLQGEITNRSLGNFELQEEHTYIFNS